MHRLIKLPILHIKLLRLNRRHKKLWRKLARLDQRIAEYNNLPLTEPNMLMGIAMGESRAEMLRRIMDVQEDLRIVQSRILTLESERVRRKRR